MEAIDFLRKKYNVPRNKQLSEILDLPRYTWGDVCDLLEEFKQSCSIKKGVPRIITKRN